MFQQQAIHAAALSAIYKAARYSADMNHGPHSQFRDVDFDAAWAMWRLLREVIPDRPLWLRPTTNNAWEGT